MTELSMEDKKLRFLRNGKSICALKPGDSPIRIGYGENSYKMERGSFTIRETIYSDKPLSIRKITLAESTAEVIFTEGRALITADGNRLRVEFDGLSNYNRLWLTLPATADEHVYGTGETFTEFDLRGHKANVWVAEHQNAKMLSKKVAKVTFGIKNGTHKEKFENYETYYAQPTFLSSKRYYFHSFATARSEFDFTNPGFHLIKTDCVEGFCIGFGDTFEQVLSDLTELVGRQPELPDWVYDGAILGLQGGTDIMMEKVENCEKH